MSNGDLNWGDDRRLLEGFVKWWQAITQVSFMRHWDTFISFSVELFPPGGYYSFSIPFTKKAPAYWLPKSKEGPKFSVPVHKVVNIRAGWLWIPVGLVAWSHSWPLWAWAVGLFLGLFFNWRRDRNSGESYWTLSFNIDQESKRW